MSKMFKGIKKKLSLLLSDAYAFIIRKLVRFLCVTQQLMGELGF